MARGSTIMGSLTLLGAVLCGACGQAENDSAFGAGVTPVEVASGNGHRGPWRQNESDFDYVDDPAVAITGDGHVAVAWADQSRKDVFLQVYGPAGRRGLPRPVNVSLSPGTFSWMPRLAIAADNPRRVYALWQEIVFSGGGHGGEIFFARSDDGGATFSAPINLSNSIAGDGKGRLTAERWDNGSLDLVAGPNGQVYAAWTEYEGRLWVSRSTDAGATFAQPVHVAGDANRAARAPALAADRGGIVHLAWSEGGHPAAVIRVAMSRDGGQSFERPQIVPSRGHADAPKLAVDPEGGLHLVFAESPDAPFQRYRIRHVRRTAAGEAFPEPRTIGTGGNEAGSVNFPDLAIDAAGHIHAVWDVFPDPGKRARGLAFTVSRDGGDSFTGPEIVPGSNDPQRGASGGLQGSLMARLAVSADGELALVNSTFAAGQSSHIWLWRRGR